MPVFVPGPVWVATSAGLPLGTFRVIDPAKTRMVTAGRGLIIFRIQAMSEPAFAS